MPISRIEGNSIDTSVSGLENPRVTVGDLILDRTVDSFDFSIVLSSAANALNRNVIFQRAGGGAINGNWQFRGRVLKPETPAFYVWHTGASGINDPNNTVVVLNSPQLNRESRYSTTTGRYTVPVSGLYQFFFGTIKSDNGRGPDGFVSRFRIRRNGVNISNELRLSENGGYGESASVVTIAECSANDFIDVLLTDSGGWYGNVYAHFGGFLIG